MKKKLLSLCLALVLVLGCLPISANAGGVGEDQFYTDKSTGIVYTYTQDPGDDFATVRNIDYSNADSSLTEIAIPETMGGLTVKRIIQLQLSWKGEWCFVPPYGDKSSESGSLKEYLQDKSGKSFLDEEGNPLPGCTVEIDHEPPKIQTIRLPKTLESWPYDKTNLQTYFAELAEYDPDYNLTAYVIDEENQYFISENGVLYSKDKTKLFLCPPSKTSLEIPNTVTHIGEDAFYLSSITALFIPQSVTKLAEEAGNGYQGNPFAGSNIKFTAAESNPSFSAENGILYSKDKTTVYAIPEPMENLSKLNAATTEIATNAIHDGNTLGCTSWPNVVIPDGITKISRNFIGYDILALTVPASVTWIYFNCSDIVSRYGAVYGEAGSAAETWASNDNYGFHVKFVAGSAPASPPSNVSITADKASYTPTEEIHLTCTGGDVFFFQIYLDNSKRPLLIPSEYDPSTGSAGGRDEFQGNSLSIPCDYLIDMGGYRNKRSRTWTLVAVNNMGETKSKPITIEIGEPKPTLTGTVNITGTEKFGQTLRASVSGGNSPSNAFTYTWKRGGSAIATGAAYTLTETDVGQTLTCEVTASDRSGSISKTTGVIGRAAGPAAPAGLKGVCPTAADTSDGKITGTTAAMEYSTDRNFASPAGTPCAAGETTGLAPGIYYVRAAATTTTEAGAATTVTVPVYVAPEVTSVVVNPASGLVLKGYTRQYTATVNGKGAYDKTVTWSVTGGTAGTSISSTGLLTVSADEELSTVLTITATSVGDNTKTGTATVTVAEYIPTPPIGGGDTPDEPVTPTEPTVETETSPDGTVTTTTTWPDGKKAVQEKAPDGSAKVEVTSSTGETIAKVDLPADPGAGKKFEDVKEGAWYEGAVDKATAYGLFNGQTETTFAPNGSMTRGMVAQVLYNLSGKTGYGAGSGNFTDVAAGKWYENAIDWAAKAEIVSGMGGGKFDPERAVTREQLVTMLYRYAQAIGADTKASMGLGSFPDSGEVTDYAETAMKWAVAEGFISGREQSDGNYIAPNGTATRAEVAAILTRFVEFLK